MRCEIFLHSTMFLYVHSYPVLVLNSNNKQTNRFLKALDTVGIGLTQVVNPLAHMRYHVFCHHAQQTGQKATPTGSALQRYSSLISNLPIFVKAFRWRVMVWTKSTIAQVYHDRIRSLFVSWRHKKSQRRACIYSTTSVTHMWCTQDSKSVMDVHLLFQISVEALYPCSSLAFAHKTPAQTRQRRCSSLS